MAFMSWTDKLSVGNELIDGEHKVWIDILNRLVDAMMDRKSSEVLSQTLDELKAYTAKHFGDEENIFEKTDYPLTEKHKEIHRGFVAKIQGFEDDLTAGKLTLTIELMNTMKDWLYDHIMKIDHEYMPYINK